MDVVFFARKCYLNKRDVLELMIFDWVCDKENKHCKKWNTEKVRALLLFLLRNKECDLGFCLQDRLRDASEFSSFL
jgi:hypothetical protein